MGDSSWWAALRALASRSGLDGRWLTVIASAVFVGVLAVVLDWRLLVPIGLGLPLVAAAVLNESSWGGAAAGGDRPAPENWTGAASGLFQHEAVIAAAWALWFLRLHVLLLAVPGVASTLLRSGIRVLVHALPLLIAMEAIRGGWPGRIPRHALLLGGFTLFATASIAWSRVPNESAERALQWVLVVGLTTYCASRAVAEPGFVDRLLTRFLRYITWGAVALGGWGVSTGFLGQLRFSWPWQHPNVAAALLLIPCIGLLFHPRRAYITRPVPWWVVVAGLGLLTYATGSRTTTAAGLVAVVAGGFLAATRDRRIGAVGVGLGLVLTGTAVGVAADQFNAWLHRGQSTDTVVGLNGRLDLWDWVLANPLGSEIWGVGVGGARGILPVDWRAQHLHSTWIDLLQSVGVIGLALMGSVVIASLVLVVLRRSVHAAWMLGFVIVISLAEIGFAGPEYPLVLLCLAIIVVSDPRSRHELDAAANAGKVVTWPHYPAPARAPR